MELTLAWKLNAAIMPKQMTDFEQIRIETMTNS